jgi:Tol biopolymer transport system component
VFDQQQVHRNVGIYSDLYALDRRTGAVRTLTENQRLQDPDLSPDGNTIVCVRQVAGRGEIIMVRLKPDTTYKTMISEIDTQFSAPRWAPDGQQIVVERHRLGSLSEIIIVDVEFVQVERIGIEVGGSHDCSSVRPPGRCHDARRRIRREHARRA